jgi:hypothetical protein
MAVEEPSTLRVVSAGKVVDADWIPSGVPGLALVGEPITTGWRLVHMPTGRAVSRSAEHPDPEAVKSLARAIAPLADWTDPAVALTVSRLREALDNVLGQWHRDYPQSPAPAAPITTPVVPETPLENELEGLMKRLRSAEHERMVLRNVLRRLYVSTAVRDFADAISGLSEPDRELIQSLLIDANAEDATAVVQAIRKEPDTRSGPAATTARVPTTLPPGRPVTGRSPGPDAAAS